MRNHNDILLVRHAHTAQSGPDARTWSLSPRGRTEAARLAQWTGWRDVQVIVTSAEAKAIETAAAITMAHPHVTTLPPVEALGEVDRRGVFVSDYEGAVAAFLAQPGASPHGWEPAAHALARFVTAMEETITAYPATSVAVVAHGLILTLYLSTLIGGSPADIAHWQMIPFASIARVARREDGAYLLTHPFLIPISG